MDRRYVLSAFGYAIIGLLLGIYMAASRDHGQLVTHAHIMLLGFVVSFIYGLCHRLWLENRVSTLASVQFYIHHGGTLILLTGLFLYYGDFIDLETIDPVLGISSVIVLVGTILMSVMLLKAERRT